MVKQHMSSIDVAGQVACLNQKLLGLRVSNVYDLNAKTYLLKLSKSGTDGDKVFLVLESGVRFHTTQVLPDKSDIPSNMSLKLRKHMRTKRLDSVRQLGVDRIVDFTFGSGEVAVHLILELYAQGNIVLTDYKYEVLTLLRSHRDDDKGFAVMARHPYPMSHVRLRTRVGAQDVINAAASAQPGMNLKGLVAQVVGYGPAIAEHVILDAGLVPHTTVVPATTPKPTATTPAASAKPTSPDDEGMEEEGAEEAEVLVKGVVGEEEATPGEGEVGGGAEWQLPPDQLQALDEALGRLDEWFVGLDSGAPPGFITCLPPGGKKKQQQKQQPAGGKKGKGGKGAPADAPAPAAGEGGAGDVKAAEGDDKDKEMVVYNEFHPLLMHQFQGVKSVELATFDMAIDEFFGKIAGQRADMARAEAEKAAYSKLDKIRNDQTARAAALAREADECELRGTLIEYNLEAVDAVIHALNQSLATGMDWHDLERLIKEERKAGNPVAMYIHSLQLDANRATLVLVNQLDDEEEGDEEANARKATKVTIDLGLTAFANAAVHYDSRKKHVAKQAKTIAANESALKAAEKKAAVQLLKVRATPTATVARKPHWFERFNWFITSENYLVISGRDAQQNELIVKRYFRKGDAYVHAELHGASSTIVKNPNPDQPLPPLSLQQVSKAAPTGEYLPTGSFMIRGRKNFLPPQPLVFGFGFMFKLEPSCIAAHLGERAVRTGTETDMMSLALTNMDGDDVDVGDMDLGVPDVDEPDESAQSSALDRFMSGTYTPAALSGAPANNQLTRAYLAAVGGTTTASDLAGQYSRYGLEVDGDIEGEGGETNNSAGVASASIGAGGLGAGAGKRHLSAKEKEAMRKGKTGAPAGAPTGPAGAAGVAGGSGQGQQGQGTSGAGPQQGGGQKQGGAVTAAAAAAGASQQQGGMRGKKGKQQKIKDKYADQDEDERQLAVALMASAGDKKTRADRRKDRKGRKEASRQAAQGAVPGADGAGMADAIAAATRKQYQQTPSGQASEGSSGEQDSGSEDEAGAAAGTTGAAAGSNAAEARRHKAGQAVACRQGAAAGSGVVAGEAGGALQGGEGGAQGASGEAGAGDAGGEAAEVAALLAEELAAGEMAEEDKEKLTVLDSLTGCPRPDDILLFAVPVCGPYSTLQSFKFKVKLTPGTVKKGKAARQGQELLSRAGDATAREKELIKAVPDMDMINAMVGTVKVSMPGLAAKQTAAKAAKKSAAKAAARKD